MRFGWRVTMWRRWTMAVAAMAVAICGSTAARAQELPCDSFQKNPDGSWTAIHSASVPGAGRYFNVRDGAVFRPGAAFMGLDLAAELDQKCPAVPVAAPAAIPEAPPAAVSGAPTRVALGSYADANGNIDAQKLTCGQLLDTSQQDADFLGLWLIGRANGLTKKSAINIPHVQASMRYLISYCRANKDKRIVQAIDVVLKGERP
jgi:hypothetical protein